MSDWRRLLAETETAQTHPFNPLNPTLSSQTDNLKDKKDHFAGFENQVEIVSGNCPPCHHQASTTMLRHLSPRSLPLGSMC